MTNGQGGPLDATKPLVLKIFETAFKQFEMGYAAAQTVVLFAILLAISLLQLRSCAVDDRRAARGTSRASIARVGGRCCSLGGIAHGDAVRVHAVGLAQAQ